MEKAGESLTIGDLYPDLALENPRETEEKRCENFSITKIIRGPEGNRTPTSAMRMPRNAILLRARNISLAYENFTPPSTIHTRESAHIPYLRESAMSRFARTWLAKEKRRDHRNDHNPHDNNEYYFFHVVEKQ